MSVAAAPTTRPGPNHRPGPPPPPQSGRGRRLGGTRRLLFVLGAISMAITVGLSAYIGVTSAALRSGLDTIGQQSAPLVKASSDLYFALNSMDQQAADVLLVGTDPGLSDSRTYALNAYQESEVAAEDALRQIAADAPNDPNIQGIADSTADRIGQYKALVTEAFLLNQQGGDPAGKPSAQVLTLYRQATDSMQVILTEVQGMTNSSSDQLNSIYDSQRASTSLAEVLLIVFGAISIGCLVVVQILLVRRVRRWLNPALAVATVIALGVTVLGASMVANENHQLFVAKSQAFDSIITLSQARSTGYDATADESRFLIDPQRRPQYQADFQSKSQTVSKQLDAEMNNITFAGEQTAANKMLAAYQKWQGDDQHMRSLVDSGNLTAATNFVINDTPGNAFYDFIQYDIALFGTSQINQAAFDGAISNADSSVSGWTATIPAVTGLLIIGLIALGLWPRIAEYR
ncbi:MAG TPA: hypothetical protein VF444_16880 [Pseudonocardiaceae bacterium]